MDFIKKVKVEFIVESLGVSLAVYGVALFSPRAAWVCIGAFLVWLVESAD